MRSLVTLVLAAGLWTGAETIACAADVNGQSRALIVVSSEDPPPPPRRYLTTYMAKYPFGVLREDYTPLGAPGVSKADYFGRPMLTATLHVKPKRHARRTYRTVVSARY